MLPALIIGFILIYSFFVIRKKAKDIKMGKACGSCSASCPAYTKCQEFSKEDIK